MGFRLSVNLNKVALLRNSRSGNFPSVEAFAELSLDAGAQGLTAHPRPDQRHIRPSDIVNLSKIARARNVEFNIEGNPFAQARDDYPGLVALVEQNKPDQCTLVPDSDTQLTSDHGFDLNHEGAKLKSIIADIQSFGTRVSLFMDPIEDQIKLAKEFEADAIELYTGPYAWAYENNPDEGQLLYDKHYRAAETARSLRLGINAGHDLNLKNLETYRNLPGLSEVSIGHALTVDALTFGFEMATKKYLALCD